MLELPEVLTIAEQLRGNAAGKTVVQVLPPTKPHKFCWFQGDPASYESSVKGSRITSAKGFGIYVELSFENGFHLCFNDGIHVSLLPLSRLPKSYQLAVILDTGEALVFTISMYGGLILHDGFYQNEYYQKSRQGISPFSVDFPKHFRRILTESKPGLSVKAFLATEQRFPGIGNGVLQDILWLARIHPKRKIGTLTDAERERLLTCIQSTLEEMTRRGGRDTEKDLWGKPGGYQVRLSKNTLASGCPLCHGSLVKETYLGGSVYFCPSCQPLEKA